MCKEEVPEAAAKPIDRKDRKPWPTVITLGLILVAAGTAGYLQMTRSMRTDKNSDSPWDKDGSADKEMDQKDWLDWQKHQQPERVRLLELAEKAELIRQDVDSLEKSIDAYGQQSEDLMGSDAAKRLMNSEQAVKHFFYEHGDVLRDKAMVKNLRTMLDNLMLPVERAVSQTGVAYEPSPKVMDEIDLIRSQVEEANGKYDRHLRLLAALTRAAAEERPGNAGDRKDITPATREQSKIEELLEISTGKKKEVAEQPEREEAIEDRGIVAEPRTPPQD